MYRNFVFFQPFLYLFWTACIRIKRKYMKNSICNVILTLIYAICEQRIFTGTQSVRKILYYGLILVKKMEFIKKIVIIFCVWNRKSSSRKESLKCFVFNLNHKPVCLRFFVLLDQNFCYLIVSCSVPHCCLIPNLNLQPATLKLQPNLSLCSLCTLLFIYEILLIKGNQIKLCARRFNWEQ